MDRMLYVAMSGAKQMMIAQAANAHNLANVSTFGFRADLSSFRSMPVFGEGHPSRVYAMAERPGTDFATGSIIGTGRDLDVAIKTDGWISVLGEGAREAYTRNGSLQIVSGGRLLTSDGHAVMGNLGPIALPPADKIEIAPDGTISLRIRGQDATAPAVVDRIRLVKPYNADLVKGNDGLMYSRDPNQVVLPDAAVQLVSSALETSNVNAVDSMITMISLARQFEMQVKLMTTAERNDRAAASIMRIT
ncbi:MAG TPA: flagellar basal body rod protein FlgF [Acidiferrobacteraceae bacterium]|nr:flagellar basal body rod protein FlgF [Acidiferrobacteraceae bacterium]